MRLFSENRYFHVVSPKIPRKCSQQLLFCKITEFKVFFCNYTFITAIQPEECPTSGSADVLRRVSGLTPQESFRIMFSSPVLDRVAFSNASRVGTFPSVEVRLRRVEVCFSEEDLAYN